MVDDERTPADRSPSSAKPVELCDHCYRTWAAQKTPSVDHAFQDRPNQPATPEQVTVALRAARNEIKPTWQPTTSEDMTA